MIHDEPKTLLLEALEELAYMTGPLAKYKLKRLMQTHRLLTAMTEGVRLLIIKEALKDQWEGYVLFTDDLEDALEGYS